MVTVKKKTRNGKEYYYLEHSIRIDKQIIKKEKYIGKKFPDNVEKQKPPL